MLNFILAGLVLPAIACLMLSLRPRRPFGGWVSTLILTLGMTSFSFLTVPWAYLGLWVRYVLAALFVIALIISFRRRVDDEVAAESPMRMMVKILIGFFFLNVTLAALRAHVVPAGAVDLTFPLAGSRYVVVHGGSTPATNTYAGRGAESYSVDVMATVGELVVSPCKGMVIAAKPLRLRCGEVIVEMRGVQLAPPFARVTEKQVHMHAERNGQPVPMTFDGRWLVRNDIGGRASRPPSAARPAPR